MSKTFYIYTTGLFNWGEFGKRTPYCQWSTFVLSNLLTQIRTKFQHVSIVHFDPMLNAQGNKIKTNNRLPYFGEMITTFDRSLSERYELKIQSIFVEKYFDHKVKNNHIIIDYGHVYNASRKDISLKPGQVYDYTANKIRMLNVIYPVDYAGDNYYENKHCSNNISWLDPRQGSALFIFKNDTIVTFIDKLKIDQSTGKNDILTIYDDVSDETEADERRYLKNIDKIKSVIKHTINMNNSIHFHNSTNL
jgi:hypothetical protein